MDNTIKKFLLENTVLLILVKTLKFSRIDHLPNHALIAVEADHIHPLVYTSIHFIHTFTPTQQPLSSSQNHSPSDPKFEIYMYHPNTLPIYKFPSPSKIMLTV